MIENLPDDSRVARRRMFGSPVLLVDGRMFAGVCQDQMFAHLSPADRAGDGLADPPGGVGGELVAAPILELVHRLHQADIAFEEYSESRTLAACQDRPQALAWDVT